MRILRPFWYLAHVLAGIVIAFLAWGLYMNLVFLNGNRELPEQMPLVYAPFVFVALIGIFSCWGWMLTDFFRNRPVRRPAAWGWFLVLGNYIGALVYFFLVWRPRER
jgi:hypothetical protein